MSDQLQISFPPFPREVFDKVKQHYALQDQVKLQKEIEHLKHVVAGFKGYRTKRKTKKR